MSEARKLSKEGISTSPTYFLGAISSARASPLLALALLLAAISPALAADPVTRGLAGDPGFEAEACAAMALPGALKPADIFDACGLDPALGRGARLPELARGLKKLGVTASLGRGSSAEKAWPLMLAELKSGRAVILEDPQPRLICGARAGGDEVSVRAPKSGELTVVKRAALFKDWGRGGAWLSVRAAKIQPPRLSGAARFRPYAFARHCRELRKTLPRGFSLVLEAPFVVAGDEPRAAVERRARGTVRWVTRRLKESFFTQDPKRILTVWLFRDAPSYRRNAEALFGDKPSTPYGYYSSRHDALVMNIATGGGTLCHEVVHPFIEANFPRCPAWLNEGLGSLYEACRDKDKRIVGVLNWRLSGLQTAIKDKRRPSIASMVATTRSEFYGAQSGVYYAQARYLCYYLQEKGQLRAFYKRFHKDQASDPSGAASLKAIVGDLAAFDKRFETWASGLKGR